MNSNSYPHFIPGCRMQSQIKNWYSILGCRRQLGIASSFFLSNSQHRNAWTLTLDLSYSGVLEILYTNQNPILSCRRQPWSLLSLYSIKSNFHPHFIPGCRRQSWIFISLILWTSIQSHAAEGSLGSPWAAFLTIHIVCYCYCQLKTHNSKAACDCIELFSKPLQ